MEWMTIDHLFTELGCSIAPILKLCTFKGESCACTRSIAIAPIPVHVTVVIQRGRLRRAVLLKLVLS